MKIVSAIFQRSGLCLAVGVLLTVASTAGAQTPESACAADSLYLISPKSVHLDFQTTEPLGMVISWPNLDISEATCFTLRDTTGLGFPVDVSGGFGAQVERVFRFTTLNSGVIGSAQGAPLRFTWTHQGSSRNGAFEGVLNLANNGGFWRYDAQSQEWSQLNQGLPLTWRQVNVVAFAENPDGDLIAALTNGSTFEIGPVGLFMNQGAGWTRIAEGTFNSSTLVTRLATSPVDPATFLVGTKTKGLFLTHDGGASFTQLTTQLDPGFEPMPNQFPVRSLVWSGNSIFVHVDNFGFFRSNDGGAGFSRVPLQVLENLDAEIQVLVDPVVNDLYRDPVRPNRLLASLQFHGVFESTDDGATWHDLYGDLLVANPDVTGEWINNALSCVTSDADPDVIVMAVAQKGLYRTTDGGLTWQQTNLAGQSNLAKVTRVRLLADSANPEVLYALEDGFDLLRSLDYGATWERWDGAPELATALNFRNAGTADGDILLATYAGGVYQAGSVLNLSDTYTSGTSPELRSLDLGLMMSFGSGSVEPNDEFRLVCQTFQGWAVWRSPSADPEHPVLIGLYDLVNPESCQEGYCGGPDILPIPRCFKEKRAACFSGTDAGSDTLRFFDSEVYNGFSYYYSVTTFDYGNTALTTVENTTNTMLFSPRWQGDENSLFNGTGNQSFVQVNLGAAPDTGGDEIYVFPNPLRPGAGLPGFEGRSVVFTNLPQDSRIQVFTAAGDDVMELGPELMKGGQIYWNTENRDQQSVAPGVYIYKVVMPQREEYWGRLIVIR